MDIINSFEIENETFYYYDLNKVISNNNKLKKLPIVLKILLESNLRKAKNSYTCEKIINIFSNRLNQHINYYPSRVVMQDFSGIPAIVDLASMRDTVKKQGKDVSKVNPQIMVDLVIDHSLDIVDLSDIDISKIDEEKEHQLNKEKYKFIKWAEKSFSNLRVVPPGSGICHQVNLEYLSTILHVEKKEEKFFLYPETIIGTDSKIPMINSLGVLGWAVEGIQAQAAMLGLPISISFPKIVGVNLHGDLKEGISSSDLVLTLISKLKEHNVDGKIIEFYGKGLKSLTLEDRSTISNMASEYGARSSFFAIDDKTISYFDKTRDNDNYGKLLKTYLKKQHLFYNEDEILDYDEIVDLDFNILEPTVVGPKRPQDQIEIKSLKDIVITNEGSILKDADIVIAAITSCTSTSNPYLLIHAALIAKKAYELGLKVNSHVKTLFAPGSIVVKEYLEKLDLLKYLEAIGFQIDGYGCITCYGNSGDLKDTIEDDIKKFNLNVCSVTAGNRNFEDRTQSLIKSNYLMSPSLVIAYSLTGSIKFDLFNDVLGVIDDKDIKLKDIWPSDKEVGDYMQKLDYTLYRKIYKDIFKGNEFWQRLDVENNDTYAWDKNSTYIQPSQIFEEVNNNEIKIEKAEFLALLGDNISIEHISPQDQIPLYSPAAKYLEEKGIKSFEYNSFASRRANSDIVARGTFDNIRLQNFMVSKEGGYTKDYHTGEIVSIFEKAMRFKTENKNLVIIAGEKYGTGAFVGYAAKGTRLLGVKAVIAKSFDENHRMNLINFGVLPLEFIDDDIKTLKLKGNENITIESKEIKENLKLLATIQKDDLEIKVELKCRIDNPDEVKYFKNGGVLAFLLKSIVS